MVLWDSIREDSYKSSSLVVLAVVAGFTLLYLHRQQATSLPKRAAHGTGTGRLGAQNCGNMAGSTAVFDGVPVCLSCQ
jgi:hypothetical protein